MKYLLDTITVSYYIRGLSATVRHFQAQRQSELVISAVTAMELAYGMERRGSATLTTAVRGVLSAIPVLPFDRAAALKAGAVRASMERTGVSLSLPDSQIAGHAIVLGLTLISADAVFKGINGLIVKDWTKP